MTIGHVANSCILNLLSTLLPTFIIRTRGPDSDASLAAKVFPRLLEDIDTPTIIFAICTASVLADPEAARHSTLAVVRFASVYSVLLSLRPGCPSVAARRVGI